jgi:hypothetical protein
MKIALSKIPSHHGSIDPKGAADKPIRRSKLLKISCSDLIALATVLP